VIRVDGTGAKEFWNERWIDAINMEIQDVIDGL